MNKRSEEIFKKCSKELERLRNAPDPKIRIINRGFGYYSFRIERHER